MLSFLFSICLLPTHAEFVKGDMVCVRGEKSSVYKGKEVIFTATKAHKLKVISLNGKWLAVSWEDKGNPGRGWISASEVSKVVAVQQASPKKDLTPFTTAAGKHPKKRELHKLLTKAGEGYAQKAVAAAVAGLKLDPDNALLHYMAAKGKVENSQWSSGLKALTAGHESPAAYQYVVAGGMASYLGEPAHIASIQTLAKELKKRADKKGGEQAVALLNHIRQVGLRLIQCQPYSTLNMRVGIGLATMANAELKKTGQSAQGATWLKKTQGAIAQQDSEEIMIVREYLEKAGMGSVEKIMGFLIPLAMAEASGIKLKAKSSGPTEVLIRSKGDDGTQRRGFFRRASSYDFLGSMITDASAGPEEVKESQNEDEDMLDYFAGQEKSFVGKLKSKSQRLRVKTAKQFLAASLSGQDSTLFRKLMSPRTSSDRADRKRWDEACDKAFAAKSRQLARMAENVPDK
ncbi:MAG: hypothetical protein QGF00_29880 [Planctomycetota bacterium]|jgi:hypothetical protein|nr:hypothetical protein [Planctomycetota bacterium]MDP7253848.1 hypothetical protein [Planctomycetota bacterium]